MKNFRKHKSKPLSTRARDDGRERREPRVEEKRDGDAPRRPEANRNGVRRDEVRAGEHRNEVRRNEVGTHERRHEVRTSGANETREAPAKRVESAPDESHLYGVSPVLEALRAGHRRIERITIAEGAGGARFAQLFELAREFRVPVRRAPRAELQRMAAVGANHQGVVAHVAAVAYAEADELLDALTARVGTGDPPLAVVLDGVEDPRNLGAIIRTAECAGVHGLFVPERRAVGLTETVAKASAGALEYLPVARATNIARLVEEFKERGIWTVGTDAEANIAYTDWDWTQPCALLFGGEGAGLRRLVRERCDALVSIPLHGRISSLNVSVAAAVVLYEAVRQRTLARPATYEEGRDGDEATEAG
ncbi:MAG TPA: 23S rRNA (guanosine(2251)-2'-O)-methyltransferase RlmB [Pyrinomonadaceae bacterium]|jgi:23S rRNA (guanosine2251-2'-O)-methyltransferase